tara:strand:+ start:2245 stop:2655 length:411 start_codon:yes stop_codon:yes gene_type:complete
MGLISLLVMWCNGSIPGDKLGGVGSNPIMATRKRGNRLPGSPHSFRQGGESGYHVRLIRESYRFKSCPCYQNIMEENRKENCNGMSDGEVRCCCLMVVLAVVLFVLVLIGNIAVYGGSEWDCQNCEEIQENAYVED